MTTPDADYSRWIGSPEVLEDWLTRGQARAAAAMFDLPESPYDDGAELPPLWHWFYFLSRTPQQALAPDGHATRGDFLPPIPYPRRMIAGGRLTFHRPLILGAPARRERVVHEITLKSGRSGSLAFVRVGSRYLQHGALCIEEEQDIVYRESIPLVDIPTSVPPRPVSDRAHLRTVHPDSRLLFRFSALTFNAHRIHYDREYARDVEGYPGLVVHGPLLAMWLLAHVANGPSGETRQVREFVYRSERPAFDGAPLQLAAESHGATETAEAQRPDGLIAQSATATFS